MYGCHVVIVVSTIFILMLLILCYSLPFSQLFRIVHSYDDMYDQVEAETKIRSENAKQYFKRQNPKESSLLYNDRLQRKNLTFVLGIVTVQRLQESSTHSSYGYLLQSAASLDKILKKYTYFNNSIPFICNVDTLPQKHLDAVNLYQFMPYVERYGLNSMGIAKVNIPGSNISFSEQTLHFSKYHKETSDYTFCLLSAAALNPQYIILLEDDTLTHRDFPTVLENLLETRLKHVNEHFQNRKFAFLKLYFPAKWQGFAFEVSKLLDLLSWSVVGGLLFHLICLSWSVRQRHLSSSRTHTFLIGCLVTIITCLLIGRQNINELRRISKYFYRLQSSEGCCTQAMLYPNYVVDSLTHYLVSNSSNRHTDLAILDFSDICGFPSYQVEPNLFYHVGLHTTLDMGHKHPEEFIVHV